MELLVRALRRVGCRQGRGRGLRPRARRARRPRARRSAPSRRSPRAWRRWPTGWPPRASPRSRWRRPACTGSRSGTCWRSAGFELLLVNARHVKNLPGRKTDVRDADWIAELLEHGLLRGSFVPPAADPRAAGSDPLPQAADPGPQRRSASASRRCWRTPASSWARWPPTCWASRAGRCSGPDRRRARPRGAGRAGPGPAARQAPPAAPGAAGPVQRPPRAAGPAGARRT